MEFSVKNVATELEILKRHSGSELTVPITLQASAFTKGVCKAGNPIKADGTVSNTADAVGILLKDVYEERPIGTIVKAFATVNVANINANAGIELSEDVKNALKNVVFE